MIVGNKHVQDIMRQYIQNVKATGKVTTPFIVFHGPDHVWKSSFALDLAQDLVGPFGYSDILHIKDFSQIIGKKHTLKVEQWEDIEYDVGQKYEDLGAREIREWMAKTSAGEYKVLILENIERMTISAANAFLKYFEEPFPKTLIIATTRNKSEIMDTVISRGLLIAFTYVSDDEVKKLLIDAYPETSDSKLQALVDLAAGRPWFVLTLMGRDKEMLGDLQDSILRFIALHQQGVRISSIFRLLVEMQKKWYIEVFLDTLLYHYEREENYHMIAELIETRKKLWYNISAENVLFSFALHDAQ